VSSVFILTILSTYTVKLRSFNLENNFTQYESIILGGWIAGGFGCVICFFCVSFDIFQLVLVMSSRKKQPKGQTTATVIPTEQDNNVQETAIKEVHTIEDPHSKSDGTLQGFQEKTDNNVEEQDGKEEIEEDK